MGLSLTKKELATVAGYSYRQLYNIDRDLPEGKKLFQQGEGGKYDLALFVQRWVEYNVAHETADADDLDAAKARHEIVKIQKTELEVARLRGQLIDVADVRRLWADIANTVMQNFIRLPSKVGPMLRMLENTDEIEAILDQEIRGILEDLANTPLPDSSAAAEEKEMEEDEE